MKEKITVTIQGVVDSKTLVGNRPVYKRALMNLIDCGNVIEVEMENEDLYFRTSEAFEKWYDREEGDESDGTDGDGDGDGSDHDSDDDHPLGPLPEDVISEDDTLSPKQMDEALMRSGQMDRD